MTEPDNKQPARLTSSSIAAMRDKLDADRETPLVQLKCDVLRSLVDEVQESRKFFAPKSGGCNKPMVHIAGHPIRVGNFCRQLCAFCGFALIDDDLSEIAVPEGQSAEPHSWPIGGLVMVDGNGKWVVDHEDGADLPDPNCVFPTTPLAGTPAPKKSALKLVR